MRESADAIRLRKEWDLLEPEWDLVPNWMRARVFAAIRAGTLPHQQRYNYMTAWDAMKHATNACGGGWLDHYGRLRGDDGRWVFVSEPYGISDQHCRQLDAFCDKLGLVCDISQKSWHCPSFTIRITISAPPVHPL